MLQLANNYKEAEIILFENMNCEDITYWHSITTQYKISFIMQCIALKFNTTYESYLITVGIKNAICAHLGEIWWY